MVLENKSLHYAESDYRPPPKLPDIPKFSRILLDLEADLDMDYPHSIRDKPEKIGINWNNTIYRMHRHNIFNV